MGINLLNRNWFWSTLIIYIIIGLYTLFIVHSTPFLSIELEELDGKWIVKDPFYTEWAEKNHLSKGDVILSVDDTTIFALPYLKYDKIIRSAKKLSFQKPNGDIVNIESNHLEIPHQLYTQLIIPSFYFLITICLVIYLYYCKRNTPLLNNLIIFILAVSLAYISSGASGRLNNLGLVVNGYCLLLCLVVLIHFLKKYFTFLDIEWIFFENVKMMYIVPILSIILSLICIYYPVFITLRSFIILFLFLVLLIIVLAILIRGYFKYRIPQLKALFIGLIIPFFPFVFLYVMPTILLHKSLLSADVSALFLLLIPFTFIFTQLTERIFDMDYLVTRLRYYVSFSLGFTIWIVIGLYWIVDHELSMVKIAEIFFFAFLSLITLFFIKEKIDYRQRKVLFSTKGDYIHQLYTTIDKIGKILKIEDLLEKFSHEVALHLELNCVYVVTYDYQNQQLISKKESIDSLQNHLDSDTIEKLRLGEIKKIDTYYLAFIHQDTFYKRILVLNHNNSINLKEEELLWLELLLLYLNNFIDNTKMIEGLIEELKQMKQADGNQLPWLNKLLWLRFEEEKYQLAQELHDTNLQEQLHIAREVDVLIHAKESTEIQSKLVKIHEQMIASVHDLRAYCENLKPPLLDTLGLNAALEKLLQKIMKRADFVLSYTIDRLYLEDERLNLMIYRLFQELLNNALKHSYATSVEIHLREIIDGFEITYSDNGVGCDLNDIMQSDSMGIKGMQERVKAFNGQFHIDTRIHQGMSIQITVSEGSDTLDYDAHSG